MNTLPKTVTQQRRGCNLNPGPSESESSMLTTGLPSHPLHTEFNYILKDVGLSCFFRNNHILQLVLSEINGAPEMDMG